MPKPTSVSIITCWYGKQPLEYFSFLFQCSFKNRAIILFFLFLAQICISQTNEIDELMAKGEKAYLNNDILLAKEIYIKVTDLNPQDKNCWYNLAISELKLGDNNNACEHFYQAYLLSDGEALTLIKQKCPNFRNGSIMSLDDVEEKPKFIYDNKEYLLVVRNSLSRRFANLAKARLKKIEVLAKYKGRIFIQFQMGNVDVLNIKKIIVTGDQEEAEIVKKEILSVLDNFVTYISAKNKKKC